MVAGGEIKWHYYLYDPSVAAAAIFAALFGVSTVLHLYQLIRTRTWFFIPFVLGGIFETVGYIGRILSAHEAPNFTRGNFIVQSLLILIGPAFFAASIYMILGRIIRLVDGERYSPIRSRWLTKIFVAADVISFLTQGAGGGMLAAATDASSFKNGERIIIGGLFIQLFAFSVFILISALFHTRIRANPTTTSCSPPVSLLPWQRLLVVLYATSALILVRSVFRIIEYIQGSDGVLQSHEYWLYIFDSALMFACAALLNAFHPSQVLGAGGVVAARQAKANGGSGTVTDSEVEMLPPGSRDVETGTKYVGFAR